MRAVREDRADSGRSGALNVCDRIIADHPQIIIDSDER
jgi:hypothetical protein